MNITQLTASNYCKRKSLKKKVGKQENAKCEMKRTLHRGRLLFSRPWRNHEMISIDDEHHGSNGLPPPFYVTNCSTMEEQTTSASNLDFVLFFLFFLLFLLELRERTKILNEKKGQKIGRIRITYNLFRVFACWPQKGRNSRVYIQSVDLHRTYVENTYCSITMINGLDCYLNEN